MFSLIKNLFKSNAKTFLLLSIFLGILLTFIYNSLLFKKKPNPFVHRNNKISVNKNLSKTNTSNKLSKLISDAKIEYKNSYIEQFLKNIPRKSKITGKAAGLGLKITGALPKAASSASTFSDYYLITGSASPVTPTVSAKLFFVPPPVVVASTDKGRIIPSPTPKPVPVPEPSSIILSLIALTGMLAFRKKILL
jgi:hypothetical protein